MGVKFLPFSWDPRAAAAPCPPLSAAAGGAGQGTRSPSCGATSSPRAGKRDPWTADGLETRRERRGQLEKRLSPEPCCSEPFRAAGSPGMSHEGQQRGHSTTTAVLGVQGLFLTPAPGGSGDPPASFPCRGGSAAPQRIKLRKTAEEGGNAGVSLHP